MRERLVLCGDVRRKPDDETLRLAIRGPNQNINFQSETIPIRLCTELTPHLLDLLEIATFVYCADQATTRGGHVQSNMGAEWRRAFRFVIPVRDPEHWSRPAVAERLRSTLGFLSDDNYQFEFDTLSNPAASQAYLPFDESADIEFKPKAVIPFSGGLDSLAGAIEELSARNGRIILVSHRSSSKIFEHQKTLVAALSDRFPKKLLHIPVLVTTQEHLPVKDFNQRSRSFLYAAIACAAAHTVGIDRIRFFENGVVSINLPISEQIVGSRATRTTHPRVIKDFGELFGAALGHSVKLENPYVWQTKRDVVEAIVTKNCGDLIDDSVSCTRVHEMTRLHTHCGRCSQCIDRRFAVLSATAERYDSADKYACDLLTGARDDPLDRTMAESYVRAAVQVCGMNDIAFFSRFGGPVAALLDCFSTRRADDVGQDTFKLHQRHAVNVRQVLQSAVARYSDDLVGHRLPATSVVVMSVSQGLAQLKQLAQSKDPINEYWAEETEIALPEPGANPLPLQLAIDDSSNDVVVRGVTRISGAESKLIRALAATHREDSTAERAPENYRYLTAEKLADRLGYDDPVSVRQRVHQCRIEVAQMFREIHRQEMGSNDLIENRRPDGYRLNPEIRFVAISELASEETMSRRAQKRVTKRA